jgi:hypothetical protein
MQLRHGYYLTIGKTEDGRTLAICSDGTPQRGHDGVTVLSLEVVASEPEARQWFKRVRKEKPWETRH